MHDEGYVEGPVAPRIEGLSVGSEQEREDLAYKLLASLSRSRLATIHRRIAPLLQFDFVGSVPSELALQIFSYLPATSLLTCAAVSKRWRSLADDQTLWKALCHEKNWVWQEPTLPHLPPSRDELQLDEGMGESDDEEEGEVEDMMMDDSGFVSFTVTTAPPPPGTRLQRHSAPPSIPMLTSRPANPLSNTPRLHTKPDYKLLHQTHTRLYNRFIASSYRLSALQTRGGPTNAHTNTIYCLQLYRSTEGRQTLFTGSRDRTIREWNLQTGLVERVLEGGHTSSVLSLCVSEGMLASGGSDRRIVVWDLKDSRILQVIQDHEDSVLCVRFDKTRLVSCSKDRTIRTYHLPSLTPEHVLRDHRAAVNAISLSPTIIVSGSGDRSVKLWDAVSGRLLRTFENHHTRGIASIDLKGGDVLSGSSDRHLRLINLQSNTGWATAPPRVGTRCARLVGSPAQPTAVDCTHTHTDLVRSVSFGEGEAEFVVSASYDLTIKVWDRHTGQMVANLSGGHEGRIFCVGFDCTKIVSCGEDQRICVWDFAHGMDTSFLRL
ncbi:WD40-repeat-containing domain protein [Mucidula mucida]|nr:WD40-repeat-containing domain protein [Mucidula mucida]